MKSMIAAALVLIIAGLTACGVQADSASITAAEAANNEGKSAKVCGLVASAKYATETRRQPTFLNLDHPYPNHVFTALIWGSDRSAFSYPPESLRGQRICVKGTIELYKGKAEIIVSSPSQIEVQR
jgi:hypothetical protein